jgi:DNA ligase-1
MLTTSFPEFEILKEAVEDHFVIDGDLVVFSEGTIRPSEAIMKRVKHKNVTKKILFDNPSALVCHDLLEYKGKDLRSKPLRQRRIILENLLKNISKNTGAPLLLSENVKFTKWEELSEIRNNSGNLNAIGLTFKHLKGLNHDMPNREEYLIWKAPLFTIEGILLYAQRDQNLRSTLYTEFTFAVRDEQESLVPFTKAHSGLTEDELAEINEFIKKNTLDRFGPVRSVAPIHVFEIAFEGINRSSRHKSGVVLLNPIIKSWQKVKNPDEANTLNDLLDLIS